MKKLVWILVILALLAGCGAESVPDASDQTASASAASADVLTDAPVQTEASATSGDVIAGAPAQTEASTAGKEPSDGKIDLTVMSSTMVYSEVYQMLTAPENYRGKTVRMCGSFAVYEGETKYYFACLISDATACCAQGIEFILAGDYSYPDDYPALGEQICVEGVFDTYQEGESIYCTLKNAVFVH